MAEFWRVMRGRYPLSACELRLQLRETRAIGSKLLDEYSMYVGDVTPAFAVEQGKRVIMRRRAEADSFAAVLGDAPVNG